MFLPPAALRPPLLHEPLPGDHNRTPPHPHLQTSTASFQNVNLEKWASTLGDLSFQRAS